MSSAQENNDGWRANSRMFSACGFVGLRPYASPDLDIFWDEAGRREGVSADDVTRDIILYRISMRTPVGRSVPTCPYVPDYVRKLSESVLSARTPRPSLAAQAAVLLRSMSPLHLAIQ